MLSQLKSLIHRAFFVYGWNYEVLVIIILFVSVICFLFKKTCSNKKIKKFFFLILFFMYIIIVISVTIAKRSSSKETIGFCLIPFYSYYQFYLGNKEMIRQVIMNIAFFYPFGFLLSCLDIEFVKKRKWIIVIFAFAFSLCVEILQYIFHLGYAEIDDVIHNTLGAGIGVVAFTLLDRLYNKIKSKIRYKSK